MDEKPFKFQISLGNALILIGLICSLFVYTTTQAADRATIATKLDSLSRNMEQQLSTIEVQIDNVRSDNKSTNRRIDQILEGATK